MPLTPRLQQGTQLIFGASSPGKTTTKRYLYPGYAGGIALTVEIAHHITRDGNVKNLYVRHNKTGGSDAGTLTYTVHINGNPTDLQVSLDGSAAGPGTNLQSNVGVAAGDRIAVAVSRSVAAADEPGEVLVTCELE